MERLDIGVREPHLADGGGGLAFLEPQTGMLETERTPSESYRPGRNQKDLLALSFERRQVGNEASEPFAVKRARIGVDKQPGTYFDDDAPRAREMIAHERQDSAR